jgi:hypothetical protein
MKIPNPVLHIIFLKWVQKINNIKYEVPELCFLSQFMSLRIIHYNTSAGTLHICL